MAKIFRPWQVGTIGYSAGQRNTLEYVREGVIRQTNILLSFDVTTTATAPTTPLFQTLARLLRRVEIIANGTDGFINLSGDKLAAMAKYEKKYPAYGMDQSVSLATSTTTSYNVVIPIRHDLPLGRRPDDCAIDVRRLSQLTLGITWGDATDLFGTPNGATIANVSCNIEAEYFLNVPDDEVFMVRALNMISKDVTATSSNSRITVDEGTGDLYRNLILFAERDKIGADNIINGISAEMGSLNLQQRKWHSYKADNGSYFQMPTSALLPGCNWVRMAPYAEGSFFLPTKGASADLVLELDVTKTSGVETIHLLREVIRDFQV